MPQPTPPSRPGLLTRLLLGGMKWAASRRHDETPHTLEDMRRKLDRPCFPMGLSALQVRRVIDCRVPGHAGLLPARLYVPYGRVHGVVLFMHGGGYVHCGLNSHHGICCRLARQSGAAVLSIAYSLAPENRFPVAVEDCWAALRWLAGEAHRWGGPIAVAGDSAGGTLAAVLAQMARDRGGPELAMQLLYYPSLYGERDVPSRAAYAHGYVLSTRLMEWYAEQYIRTPADLSDPRLAPICAPSLAGLAPAVIGLAQCDPLHDEGTGYAAAMQQAGSPARTRTWRGTVHGFLNFYSVLPAGREAIHYGAGALRAALRARGKASGAGGGTRPGSASPSAPSGQSGRSGA
ncbi:lipase [Komagataeibacter rhaeticus]|uniref:Alpha/beta hydrolase n=1 Tax=Komagataeibacter rhaeticus TaxID=215221 RepID=A0A181CBV6_9PROT|nr:alpha/beta hydrolase [Komagataeibacter rhaeticus]ATU72344.1 alpha/beta hydrolase [Komagataeibacter xylinus]KDU96809.1 lipase [Komagataeibacter rhaeticus AF1]MBL7240202.1 alpha/beta hydrolase [Komagataeibacter rhaeticus]PYD52791.1 lipase [Komagataeibacter rhaeticus]QIP35737.1 alpha/beta hydrolase [Komagataeibacter rhaeticus]